MAVTAFRTSSSGKQLAVEQLVHREANRRNHCPVDQIRERREHAVRLDVEVEHLVHERGDVREERVHRRSRTPRGLRRGRGHRGSSVRGAVGALWAHGSTNDFRVELPSDAGVASLQLTAATSPADGVPDSRGYNRVPRR